MNGDLNEGLWFDPQTEAMARYETARNEVLKACHDNPYLPVFLGQIVEMLGWKQLLEERKGDSAFADGVAAARVEIAETGQIALKKRQEKRTPGEFE